MVIGIEDINPYLGLASLDTATLFSLRGLDEARRGNLMMDRKSVGLPNEDAVSNAVNAAAPILAGLTEAERNGIEAVIVGSESGIDFGKPISTYVHNLLGLGHRCRSFEVKHACYGGTAALRTAEGILRSAPKGSKVVVIASDAASVAARGTYWEPSQGAGAVAILVSDEPRILALDRGAYGLYTDEVMDTLRPAPDVEAGNTDLSLVSYLTALDETWQDYAARVWGADLVASFDRIVLHTPFAGMVVGAHRRLLTRRGGLSREAAEEDFQRRTRPSLDFCSEAGNVYSAALYLALVSMIDTVRSDQDERYALFSYGSGCAAEFYSGVVPAGAWQVVARHKTRDRLAARYPLSPEEYEVIVDLAVERMAGVQHQEFDTSSYDSVLAHHRGERVCVLDRIEDYHRAYRWIG